MKVFLFIINLGISLIACRLFSQDTASKSTTVYIEPPELLQFSLQKEVLYDIDNNIFQTNITGDDLFINNQMYHIYIHQFEFDSNIFIKYKELLSRLHHSTKFSFITSVSIADTTRELSIKKTNSGIEFFEKSRLVCKVFFKKGGFEFANYIEKYYFIKDKKRVLVLNFLKDTLYFYDRVKQKGFLNYTQENFKSNHRVLHVKLGELRVFRSLFDKKKVKVIELITDSNTIKFEEFNDHKFKNKRYNEYSNLKSGFTLRSFKESFNSIAEFREDYKSFSFETTTNLDLWFNAWTADSSSNVNLSLTELILFSNNRIVYFFIYDKESRKVYGYIDKKDNRTEQALINIFGQFYANSECKQFFNVDTISKITGYNIEDFNHYCCSLNLLSDKYNEYPSNAESNFCKIIFTEYNEELVRAKYQSLKLSDKESKQLIQSEYILTGDYMVYRVINDSLILIDFKGGNEIMDNETNRNCIKRSNDMVDNAKRRNRRDIRQNELLRSEKNRQGFYFTGEEKIVHRKLFYIAENIHNPNIPFLPDSILYTQKKVNMRVREFGKIGYEFKVVGFKSRKWGWVFSKEYNMKFGLPKYPCFYAYSFLNDYSIWFSDSSRIHVHRIINDRKSPFVMDSFWNNRGYGNHSKMQFHNGNVISKFGNSMKLNGLNFTGNYIELYIRNYDAYKFKTQEKYIYDTVNYDVLHCPSEFIYDSIKYLLPKQIRDFIDSSSKISTVVLVKEFNNGSGSYSYNSNGTFYDLFATIATYFNGKWIKTIGINFLNDTVMRNDSTNYTKMQLDFSQCNYSNLKKEIFNQVNLPPNEKTLDSIRRYFQIYFPEYGVTTISVLGNFARTDKYYPLSQIRFIDSTSLGLGNRFAFNALYHKNKLIDSGSSIYDNKKLVYNGKIISVISGRAIVRENTPNKKVEYTYFFDKDAKDTTLVSTINQDSVFTNELLNKKIISTTIFQPKPNISTHVLYTELGKPYCIDKKISISNKSRKTSKANKQIGHFNKVLMASDKFAAYKEVFTVFHTNGTIQFVDSNHNFFQINQQSPCIDEFPIYKVVVNEIGNPKCYDKEGNLIFKDGMGTIQLYYSNGNISEEFHCKNFIRDSIYRSFNSLGELNEIGNYKNGKRDGVWLQGNLKGSIDFSSLCTNSLTDLNLELLKMHLVSANIIVYKQGKIISNTPIQYRK